MPSWRMTSEERGEERQGKASAGQAAIDPERGLGCGQAGHDAGAICLLDWTERGGSVPPE
jgi:hypothetical protein